MCGSPAAQMPALPHPQSSRHAAHDFHDEHLGRTFAHGGDIQSSLADRHSNILGHGTEPRAGIRDRQIVVHSFGIPIQLIGKFIAWLS